MKTAKITKKTFLTEDVIQLDLITESDFQLISGQFISIRIEDKFPPCIRAYSVASTPNTKGEFSLCIKIVPEGRGTQWINTKEPGDQLNFIGPNGYFTYQPTAKNLLFIATGTGIAPFLPMITEILQSEPHKKITLLFGLRHETDIFYQDQFTELQGKHPNFTFILTLSRPQQNWLGHSGRVTAHLPQLDLTNTKTYICGLKAMIHNSVEILKQKGLADQDISFEEYD